MARSNDAEFQIGEAVENAETGERGEVVAVDYDEVSEEYTYLVRLADGREETYLAVALSSPSA